MSEARILVVDDEKNIRLTVAQCLEPQGYTVKTAIDGGEALAQLEEYDPQLMLLDLQMPGMNGLEVLETAKERLPDLHVIMISAHGNVENAVEAMKLGAVDFIQKPFTPKEIREFVARVLGREDISDLPTDYDSLMSAAKHRISKRQFDEAITLVKQAIGANPNNAEIFNMLGELLEVTGDNLQALKNYRVAIDLDPAYRPAQKNLERATSSPKYNRLKM
ncbi:response regulator [Plectonema cf. radiosum LEGE 06105]|uniref:Response regulator n=1 Tax=Plectonema cf. radiosum LEGE 06105 TaxID=945769 RepID=A0A8J7EZZ2_9CYAN|nr:response regulator [Plectonema radiosum]MBE9211890.1 response regulator [Plectonema cf. radiosum LEGE 06105]